MSQEQISHLHEIPQRVDEQQQTMALQLFSWLAKREQKEDYYMIQLRGLLERCEESIKQKNLDDRELEKILKLFVVGNIHDLSLFYRFEQLKKNSKKYRAIRLYTYGEHQVDSLFREQQGPEIIETLGNEDMKTLLICLRMEDITIDDLDTQVNFWAKIKKSYIKSVKDTMGKIPMYNSHHIFSLIPETQDLYEQLSPQEQEKLQGTMKKYEHLGREWRFATLLLYERNELVCEFLSRGTLPRNDYTEDHKSDWHGFYSHSLQKILWCPKDQLDEWIQQAKKEFIQEFIVKLQNLEFDKGYVLKHTFQGLADIVQMIQEALPSYPQITISPQELHQQTVQAVNNCLKIGIEKIQSKEIHQKKLPRKERKAMSYTHQLEQLALKTEERYKLMIDLGATSFEVQDREQNKEKYIQNFLSYHGEQFTSQKIHDILQQERIAIDQLDEIKQMIIKNMYEEFIKSCKRKIEKKYTIQSTSYPISNVGIVKAINKLLFKKWYFTLLKKVVPNDTERKKIRREIVQQIAQKAILDIQGKLLYSWSFDETLYLLLSPLHHLFKQYQGDGKSIRTNRKKLYQNYCSCKHQQVQKEVKKKTKQLDKILASKQTQREQVTEIYQNIHQIYGAISSYINNVIRENKQIRLKQWGMLEHAKENRQSDVNYPQSYLDGISQRWYRISDIEKILPSEIQQYHVSVFQKIDEKKNDIWQYILSYRFAENAQGKLTRIVHEELLREFWTVDYANAEQIQFAVDYLMDNLPEIILDDIRQGIYGGREPFRSDRGIVEKMIQDFLQQWKKTLLHNNMLPSNAQSRYVKKLPPIQEKYNNQPSPPITWTGNADDGNIGLPF